MPLRITFERKLVRRWSLRDLCARVPHLTPALLIEIERGHAVPSDELLEGIAQALNISPASVLLRPVVIQIDPEENTPEEVAS